MSAIKVNDIVQSNKVKKAFEYIAKAVDSSRESINKLTDDAKELQKALTGAGLADLVKLQKQYNNTLKATQDAEKNAIKNLENKERLKQQQLKTEQALITKQDKLRQSLVKEEKANLALVKVEKERARIEERELQRIAKLSSAYAQQSKRLNDLRKKAKDVALQYGTNSKQFKTLQKDVLKLDNSLKKIDKSLGQNQRNIGNYTKSLGGVGKQLLGALGVVGGVQLFAQALRDGFNIIRKYQKANAELAGVLGKSRKETIKLQKESKRLGATTAFSASQVTDLQIELARLGKTEEEIIASTEGIIDATIALGSETGETAALVGATLNAFNLGATKASNVADILTLSTQRSALSFEKLNTALPIVGGAAAAAGVKLETVIAQLGQAADRGIDASTAATSLRNIYIELAAKGITLEDALDRINKSQDRLTVANELFGKRAAVTAIALADNVDKANELTEALENAGGTAKRVAEEQLNTLDGRLKLLQSAWEGFILSIESGEGSIGAFVNTAIEEITRLLNFLTDSGVTEAELFSEDITKLSTENLLRYAQTFRKNIKGIEKVYTDFELVTATASDNIFRKLASIFRDEDFVGAGGEKGIIQVNKKLNETAAAAQELQEQLNKLNAIEAELERRSQAAEDEDILEITAELAKEQELLAEEIAKTTKALEDEILRFERLEALSGVPKGIKDLPEDLASDIAEAFKKSELEIAASQLRITDTYQKEADKQREILRQTAELQKELAIQGVFDLGNLAFALTDRKIAALDAELAANNQFFDERLDAEELDDEQRQILEKQREQRNAQIEKKKRAEQKKQAIINKGLSIFDIAINTATGISKTIATLGLPLAIPFVVATAALGALQTATVLAQPIPQFAKGTDNAPEGWALVSEEGPELVQEKGGKKYLTPEQPSLIKLKGGESITPAEQTSKMLQEELANDALRMQTIYGGVSTKRLEELQEENNRQNKAMMRQLRREKNNVPSTIDNSWYNRKIGR